MQIENTPLIPRKKEDSNEESVVTDNLPQPLLNPTDTSQMKEEKINSVVTENLPEPITNTPDTTQMKEEKINPVSLSKQQNLDEVEKRLPLPDPPTPVKPAKSLYKQEKRAELQSQFPELKPHLLSKKMTDMFRELTNEERAVYEEQERIETEAYNKKYQEYKQLLKERGYPSPEQMKKNQIVFNIKTDEEVVYKSKKKLLPHQTKQENQQQQSASFSFKKTITEDQNKLEPMNNPLKPADQPFLPEQPNNPTKENNHVQESQKKKNQEEDESKRNTVIEKEQNKKEVIEEAPKEEKTENPVNQSTSNNKVNAIQPADVVDENKAMNEQSQPKNKEKEVGKSMISKKVTKDKDKAVKKPTRNKTPTNATLKSRQLSKKDHSRAFI